MNYVQCYLACVSTSGLIFPLLILIGLTIACLTVFLIKREYVPLLGSQTFMTIIITINLFSMRCYMFQWIWIYVGMIFIGIVLIGTAKHYLSLQVSRNSIGPFPYISELEHRFKVPINIIDTQKIRAFAYKERIYLSVGLLEQLEKDEIKAVVAHELYHLRHSPNKFLSSFLALTSLTFLRYRDESLADKYAGKIAGNHNLIKALKKLEIKDYQKRAMKVKSPT